MTFSGDFLTSLGNTTRSCTDFAGTPAGWNLTIQTTNLTNETNNVISGTNVLINHSTANMSAGNCTAQSDT